MKNLKIRFGLFSLLAILAVSVFLTSCEQEAIEQPLITDYEKAEQILGEYVVEENGTFVLSERDPYKLGIDPTVFDELAKQLEEVNKLIDKGEVKREWINKTIDMETLEVVEIDVRGCNQNKISFGWYSATVYLSKSNAGLANAAGCIVVGLAGGWPGAACSAITAAFNRFFCSCGYRSKVTYTGQLYWTWCQ